MNAQKAISNMPSEWQLGSDLWNHLQPSNMEEQQHQEEATGWDETTVNMKRPPRYFVAEVLIKTSQDISQVFPLTKEMLDLVNAHDPHGVRKIMHMLAMTSNFSVVLMKCRKDKDFSLEMYCEMINQVGAIHLWQPHRHISEVDGGVDWLQGGPYTLIWGEDGYVTRVRFLMGCEKEVIVIIGKAFTLLDPWDVWQCTAKGPNGPEGYKLCEFFVDKKVKGHGVGHWTRNAPDRFNCLIILLSRGIRCRLLYRLCSQCPILQMLA